MRCKNCNGELVFENKIWTCASCGSKFSMTEFLGDVDVFICYSEIDESGRRTKDSVIAQDIYHLLEQNKIRTFYKRVSLEDVSGSDAEDLEEIALNTTQIVLLIGTSNSIFHSLWEKYGKSMETKKIIPVYHGMDAREIPNEISSVQALKYDQIGASTDLLSGVLHVLGRKNIDEQNYEKISQKQRTKKTIVVIVSIVIIIIVIALLSITLVLRNRNKSKGSDLKNETELNKNQIAGATSQKSEGEDQTNEKKTQEELYSSGVEYMDDGKYAKAIECFSDLGDYKDSTNKIQVCYAKYEGFYQDEGTGIILQLQNIHDNGNVKIKLTDDNGNTCKIDQSINFDRDTCNFSYIDSEGNAGESRIILNDSGLILSLQQRTQSSDLHLPDVDLSFNIEDKSDQLTSNEITLETIKSFISTQTTLGDLKRMGYDYQYERYLMDFTGSAYYRITNTDVLVAAYDWDMNTYYKVDNWLYGDYKIANVDDYIVYGVKAPAYIIAPERIGKSTDPFIDEDYIFVPCVDFDNCGTFFSSNEYAGITEISNNTDICLCCDLIMDDEYYDEIIQSFHRASGDDYEMETSNNQQTDWEYDSDSYILPKSSGLRLTENDLIDLTNDQLRKARNEIVARHGRRFQDAELQAYFDSKSWYNGTIDPDDFNMQTMLSDIERDNMDFIKEHER